MNDMAGTAERRVEPFLSPRAKARQWWLKIHRWLGLALLIPMALLGVTGSAQVWPEETEAWLNPQREVAASADPATLDAADVTVLRAALEPHGALAQIELGEVGQPVVATSAVTGPPLFGVAGPVRQQVWLDPVSGTVIDSAATSGSFMWYMHFIHGVLLIPEVGRQVVGWMGWLLLISAVTGLVVFWPGTARALAALKWQKRDGAMRNVHRQSGVILSAVIIIEAVTGAWISFPEAMASLVEPGVEQPQRRRPGGAPEGDPVAVPDAAWIVALESAKTAFPGRPQSIAAPVAADGAWQIALVGERVDATVTVPLAADGLITVEERAQRRGPPPATTRAGAIAGTMRGVHYATIGGPVWQVIVFLSGIALTFLALSGVWIWGVRKFRRR